MRQDHRHPPPRRWPQGRHPHLPHGHPQAAKSGKVPACVTSAGVAGVTPCQASGSEGRGPVDGPTDRTIDLAKVFLFDLDGSLADYDGALLADLERMRSPAEPPVADVRQAWGRPHLRARIDAATARPGWWAGLPPLQAGMAVYRLALDMGFDCQVLTKGPKYQPRAWAEKVEWGQRHLGPDVDVHVVSDKGLVYGVALYDDHPRYPVNQSRPGQTQDSGGKPGQPEPPRRPATPGGPPRRCTDAPRRGPAPPRRPAPPGGPPPRATDPPRRGPAPPPLRRRTPPPPRRAAPTTVAPPTRPSRRPPPRACCSPGDACCTGGRRCGPGPRGR